MEDEGSSYGKQSKYSNLVAVKDALSRSSHAGGDGPSYGAANQGAINPSLVQQF